jgi:hypothetical protein
MAGYSTHTVCHMTTWKAENWHVDNAKTSCWHYNTQVIVFVFKVDS